MRRLINIVGVLLMLSVVSVHGPASPVRARNRPASSSIQRAAIFIFHADEFWLNLHHFLYVLSRGQNKATDSSRAAVANAPVDEAQGFAKLTKSEQGLWREAVSAYAATLGQKDLIFDDPLPDITNALARAADDRSLNESNIDPSIVSILERAAPIYRKVWWPEHRAANRDWQKEIQALVDLHGPRVLAFITRAYQMQWPAAGYGVHISGYSNWAGAYSTKGNLLVVASLDPSIRGNYGLETIFHEGMHQWDSQIFDALRESARKQNRLVPRGLSHAMIFFTAGQAVRAVAPQHIPYADKFGIWGRGMSAFQAPLEEVWKPYLEGRGTRDEVLAELIKRTATEVRPPPKTSPPPSG